MKHWSIDHRRQAALGALMAVLALAAAHAHAQSQGEAAAVLEGAPAIVDARALAVGGRYVRLSGLDAPPLNQTCPDRTGASIAAGRRAAAHLESLIGARSVRCAHQGFSHGVAPARCSVGESDLGEAMVASGWAYADADAGHYAEAQAQARAGERGLWALSCRTPQDWRNTPGRYFGIRPSTD